MPELYSIGNQAPRGERTVEVMGKCPNCGKIQGFKVPRSNFDRLGRGGRVGEELSQSLGAGEVGADRLNLLLGKSCGCLDRRQP